MAIIVRLKLIREINTEPAAPNNQCKAGEENGADCLFMCGRETQSQRACLPGYLFIF